MSSPPPGWLKANGAVISRAGFAALCAAIGTTYGSGAGTFALPDLRGEFVRGWDDGRGVDTGRAIGTTQNGSLLLGDSYGADEINWPVYVSQSRDLFGWDPVHTPIPVGASHVLRSLYVTGQYQPPSGTDVSHGGTARPRNVAALYCIKT
jgi:hypothetical protein